MSNRDVNMTTEGMVFALGMYSRYKTFHDYDPTAAMLAGAGSDEFIRGLKLAAEMKLDRVSQTIALRYPELKETEPAVS